MHFLFWILCCSWSWPYIYIYIFDNQKGEILQCVRHSTSYLSEVIYCLTHGAVDPTFHHYSLPGFWPTPTPLSISQFSLFFSSTNNNYFRLFQNCDVNWNNRWKLNWHFLPNFVILLGVSAYLKHLFCFTPLWHMHIYDCATIINFERNFPLSISLQL